MHKDAYAVDLCREIGGEDEAQVEHHERHHNLPCRNAERYAGNHNHGRGKWYHRRPKGDRRVRVVEYRHHHDDRDDDRHHNDAIELLKWQAGTIRGLKQSLKETLEVVSGQKNVVRCKECKHGEPCKNGLDEDAIECFDTDICLEVRCRNPNWFCANGELKE